VGWRYVKEKIEFEWVKVKDENELKVILKERSMKKDEDELYKI
jgi:hypothetical protein